MSPNQIQIKTKSFSVCMYDLNNSEQNRGFLKVRLFLYLESINPNKLGSGETNYQFALEMNLPRLGHDSSMVQFLHCLFKLPLGREGLRKSWQTWKNLGDFLPFPSHILLLTKTGTHNLPHLLCLNFQPSIHPSLP